MYIIIIFNFLVVFICWNILQGHFVIGIICVKEKSNIFICEVYVTQRSSPQFWLQLDRVP